MTGVATTVSRVVTTPFRWGSAVRRARVFHPRGIICRATVTVSDKRPPMLPIRSGPATVRLSKAVGTPGGSADIAGMALRAPVRGALEAGWDILFASSVGPAQRLGVPLPVPEWTGSHLSTLAPFRTGGRLVYLRVVLRDERTQSGLSLEAIETDVDSVDELRFTLEEAVGTGPFRPVGDVTLTDVDGREHVDFDPTGTLPPGVTLFPQWLTALRTGAYFNSRRGRPDSGQD